MGNRILLTLTAYRETGEWNLTLEEGSVYSARFYNGLISQARQHMRRQIDGTVYDLIVPREIIEFYEGKLLTLYSLLDPDWLKQVITKVHNGSIRFRHVEFGTKPKPQNRSEKQ